MWNYILEVSFTICVLQTIKDVCFRGDFNLVDWIIHGKNYRTYFSKLPKFVPQKDYSNTTFITVATEIDEKK